VKVTHPVSEPLSKGNQWILEENLSFKVKTVDIKMIMLTSNTTSLLLTETALRKIFTGLGLVDLRPK